ncbi:MULTISPECIES: zinc-binding dehydrogenase [Actinoalloteichus]|uniref:Zn-dependent oxidoreductase, NADPH:quinone reductase n=1 Tax=Actinoalloteichus fjordicus TaxID=1612552 RepID=A0AAC9LC69_9PSEU|nr:MULTISPECIES: zinc-binding dehydrogenase [Actinoalloteichus]APU14911.1 Zn-dependent oxidoreductase, NADPH:quinone reductase [Actinoalloteichus fjordicus]APU20881.1 Zn-dependent oxidoreductase, NADPH:quinone reductase [Actinoalloteichus sp. GBA129-24]
MRAVWLREWGGPEVLVAGQAPDPVAGPGQVVIAVAFANITFVETQFRSGGGPVRADPPALPMIPGNGVGGVVASVGPDVDSGLIGRRVIASAGGRGGYAEQVAVDAAALFEVPDAVALDEAVALLADGRTASWLVDAVAVQPGERVLVEAAAGGVGTLLVQLASAAGARVVAAAGGPAKVEVASRLGAETAVDYLASDWVEQVRAAAGGLDVVFDGVGGDLGRAAFELLGDGGRMLSYGFASGEWAGISEEAAAERGVRLVKGVASPEAMRHFTEQALAAAEAGRLRPVIGQRFALADAAAAHAAIESRATVGKTLLEVRR